MNIFFEGLKNQISTFCKGADGFEIFMAYSEQFTESQAASCMPQQAI
jgi:hypothetical protein